MQGDDLFLTLLGPLGPMTKLSGHGAYQDRVSREMDLATVRAGRGRARCMGAGWTMSPGYAKTHPQHGGAVRQARLEIGLDPWNGDEPDELEARRVPGLTSCAQWTAVTFSPMIATTISPRKNSRAGVAASPNSTMPSSAAPTAPMPTQMP